MFDLENFTEHDIPEGTRVVWCGDTESPPSPEHHRGIFKYTRDASGPVAFAGWVVPSDHNIVDAYQCELCGRLMRITEAEAKYYETADHPPACQACAEQVR